jgi:hypothetical protein
MTYGDTVARVLRGKPVSAQEKIDALVEIASKAVHEKYRLATENRRLRDALELITTLPSKKASIVEAPHIARRALREAVSPDGAAE